MMAFFKQICLKCHAVGHVRAKCYQYRKGYRGNSGEDDMESVHSLKEPGLEIGHSEDLVIGKSKQHAHESISEEKLKETKLKKKSVARTVT